MAAGTGTVFFREPVIRLQGVVIRRYATFTAGLAILGDEVIVSHVDRPYVVAVALALIGLPGQTEN